MIMAIISSKLSLEQTQSLLFTMFDKFDSSVALFDDQDRLVFCNEEFCDDNEALGGIIQPGVPMLDIVKARFKNGILPTRKETPYEWVKTRLSNSNGECQQSEIERLDGRTLLALEQRRVSGP